MHTHSLWAARVAAGTVLPDKRLPARLASILATFAERPSDAIPQAAGSWGQAKGVYRFLANPRVQPAALQQGLTRDTAWQCLEQRTVLVVQDTTSLHLTAPREMQRGGVLDHQDGPLLQALPGRVPGETLLQGGRLHTRVGQEAIDPLGLSPAACGLRDGIARPLRERCQYGGQAGRKAFVRQNCSRRHPRRPERVCVHRATLTRYQILLSFIKNICIFCKKNIKFR